MGLKNKIMRKLILPVLACAFLIGCTKDEDTMVATPTPEPSSTGPYLIFKFNFDPTLPRLDNFGNPTSIPAGNAAQSPDFKFISAHYIEFAQDSTTQIGDGFQAYKGQETTAGGSNAVSFDDAVIKSANEEFVKIPISSFQAGTYNWLRVSLTYQNYSIDYISNGTNQTGRLASFVGFNNYITDYQIENETVTLNENKLQGYWGFETTVLGNTFVFQGQTEGTTVPNPIASTSPINPGSCVVTGSFDTPFTITGNETENITVNMRLSTNNSFEWKDLNGDGSFEPSDGTNAGDTVVDMGLRGLYPVIE